VRLPQAPTKDREILRENVHQAAVNRSPAES
jgi:hypothetical protein